jgi:hypothetical protein
MAPEHGEISWTYHPNNGLDVVVRRSKKTGQGVIVWHPKHEISWRPKHLSYHSHRCGVLMCIFNNTHPHFCGIMASISR